MLKKGFYVLVAALVLTVFAAASFPGQGQAHCDSEKGPVVEAAKKALETGNVNLVLPYVQADSEAEIVAGFKHTLEVRKLSPRARELADHYFYELVVRVHREGEGAAYTGITTEEVPEAIKAADKAMQTGQLDPVSAMLLEEIEHGLQEKYEKLVSAREEAKKAGTVEANRERAEAELLFEKYVYELHLAAAGAGAHDAEGAPAASGHGH